MPNPDRWLERLIATLLIAAMITVLAIPFWLQALAAGPR